MVLYIGIPGADLSAVPAKQGTQTFLSDDPLPILSLPGLLNWWNGDDAAVAASILSWTDRVQSKTLAAASAGVSPTIITGDNGKKAVHFVGAGKLDGPAATLNQANTYTLLYVLKPSNPLVIGALVGGNSGAGIGRVSYQWNTGYLAARNGNAGAPSQPSSSAGKIVASTTVIAAQSFDAANMKYGFSFNGVFDKYVGITGISGAEDQATAFTMAGTPGGTNLWSGDMYDLFLFAGDLHATANAGVLAYIIAKMKSRYGIA